MHDWMDGDTGGSEKQAMHGGGGGIEGRKAERRAHPTPPACSAAMLSPILFLPHSRANILIPPLSGQASLTYAVFPRSQIIKFT